ncbi:putative reverse transcriptase domain-containing protein [Tanacetum coccineum]
MKRFMLPKWDVNNVKDPITPKTVRSKKKVKPLKKLIILSLVYLFNEVDIEQQLEDSTKEIMQMLRASISVMPLSTYLNLGLGELAHTKLTVELADRSVKYPKGILENVLVRIGKFAFLIDFIILDIPEDVKVPLILRRPFLSTAHAKIDVFKRKITLRVGDEKIVYKSMKPASSLIKRVYMLDLNVPLEIKRDQVDDLIPTIEEVEVIDEPMINRIKTRNNESFDKEFYNSIMKEKVEYKGKNVVGALMNVPIFVGNFSVVTHFALVENIDDYRDQDMGDVIFGEPFCKASCVEPRRSNGIITIHNGLSIRRIHAHDTMYLADWLILILFTGFSIRPILVHGYGVFVPV